MGYHARLSPSGAARWSSCTASPAQSEGKPNESSAASRPGTALHQAGAECLEEGYDPGLYLGRAMAFMANGEEGWMDELPSSGLEWVRHTYTINKVDIHALRYYVEHVRELHARIGGRLLVERDVPIDHMTLELGATGRSDVIILSPPIITVCDAKFGRKKVRAYDVIEPADVDPLTGAETPQVRRMNLQLAMYADGALRKYGSDHTYNTVRAVVVQPFIDNVSEFECSTQELMGIASWLYERADATRYAPEFAPSFENCLFCAGKIDCTARAKELQSTYAEGFEDCEEEPF